LNDWTDPNMPREIRSACGLTEFRPEFRTVDHDFTSRPAGRMPAIIFGAPWLSLADPALGPAKYRLLACDQHKLPASGSTSSGVARPLRDNIFLRNIV